MSDDFKSRLGWKKPEEKDERDFPMALAIEKLKPPDDALADKTIRQAYDEGYFASWKAILSFWRWIKAFFWPTPKPPPAPLRKVRWFDPEQLDQGNTPHCVGFAATQFLNCDPIEDHLDNAYGHETYYACKILDGEPMAEDGTSVHSAASVLQDRGMIKTYVWAEKIEDIKTWVLEHGPVIVGTDWYTQMFYPDATGHVDVSGAYEGGHAYIIVGYDEEIDEFAFQNSWGAEWGDKGYFYIRATEWAKLFTGDPYAEACTTVEISKATFKEWMAAA